MLGVRDTPSVLTHPISSPPQGLPGPQGAIGPPGDKVGWGLVSTSPFLPPGKLSPVFEVSGEPHGYPLSVLFPFHTPFTPSGVLFFIKGLPVQPGDT